MGRKLVVLGVLSALVGSGAVIGAMVPAASQQSTTTISGCEQLRTEYSRTIDERKKGFGVGDTVMFANKLLNPQTGNKMGRVAGKLIILKRFRKTEDVSFFGDLVVSLPKGKVTAFGNAKFGAIPKGVKFAVTGGTGIYNRAQGAAIVKATRCRGQGGIRFTLNLVG
jgi:hypothetical protein